MRVRCEKGRRHADRLAVWERFKANNNTFKEYVLNSQIEYEKNCIDQIKSNPKIFHSYKKHKKACPPIVGPIKTTEGEITDDPKSMANCFADTFLAVITDIVPPSPAAHQSCNSYFDFQSVDNRYM